MIKFLLFLINFHNRYSRSNITNCVAITSFAGIEIDIERDSPAILMVIGII